MKQYSYFTKITGILFAVSTTLTVFIYSNSPCETIFTSSCPICTDIIQIEKCDYTVAKIMLGVSIIVFALFLYSLKKNKLK